VTKIEQIQRILERRIRHGDYLLTGLPAERDLSNEVGASRMTARKAIERLLKQGLLKREANGRLAISTGTLNSQIRVGLLVPTITSGNVERWRLAIEQSATDFNSRLRTILYVHWDDPIIIDAMESFDCVFVFPSCEDIPPRIIDRFREAGRSLIMLEDDYSAAGIRSICLFPKFFVQRLLDHLGELGHRHIDCFNIQTTDSIIRGRIEQWELWRAMHKIRGSLVGQAVRPFTPYNNQLDHAYTLMKETLAQNKIEGTAVFCTTAIAAIGAMRAMRECGINVGKDISVCTINDEGLAKYVHPSLTCIEMPDPGPFIRICLERFKATEEHWTGSLLIQPSVASLFTGESTVQARTD
jgi:LacI family transcriptional regulator